MTRKTKLLVYGAIAASAIVALSLASARRTEGVVATAVQVVNTPLPVDTDFGARIPFQTHLTIENDVFLDDRFAAPPGKVLVIDHVSGNCVLDGGDAVGALEVHSNLQIAGPDGAVQTEAMIDYFPPVYSGLTRGTVGQPTVTYSGPTRIYSSPGDVVTLIVQNQIQVQDSCEISISGYLIRPPA
jgi:hypothetical protein